MIYAVVEIQTGDVLYCDGNIHEAAHEFVEGTCYAKHHNRKVAIATAKRRARQFKEEANAPHQAVHLS